MGCKVSTEGPKGPSIESPNSNTAVSDETHRLKTAISDESFIAKINDVIGNDTSSYSNQLSGIDDTFIDEEDEIEVEGTSSNYKLANIGPGEALPRNEYRLESEEKKEHGANSSSILDPKVFCCELDISEIGTVEDHSITSQRGESNGKDVSSQVAKVNGEVTEEVSANRKLPEESGGNLPLVEVQDKGITRAVASPALIRHLPAKRRRCIKTEDEKLENREVSVVGQGEYPRKTKRRRILVIHKNNKLEPQEPFQYAITNLNVAINTALDNYMRKTLSTIDVNKEQANVELNEANSCPVPQARNFKTNAPPPKVKVPLRKRLEHKQIIFASSKKNTLGNTKLFNEYCHAPNIERENFQLSAQMREQIYSEPLAHKENSNSQHALVSDHASKYYQGEHSGVAPAPMARHYVDHTDNPHEKSYQAKPLGENNACLICPAPRSVSHINNNPPSALSDHRYDINPIKTLHSVMGDLLEEESAQETRLFSARAKYMQKRTDRLNVEGMVGLPPQYNTRYRAGAVFLT